jgi:hypothetical protein
MASLYARSCTLLTRKIPRPRDEPTGFMIQMFFASGSSSSIRMNSLTNVL